MILNGFEAAQAKLNAAIDEYMLEAYGDSSYVSNWFLMADISDINDPESGSMAYCESPHLGWVTRRGLLEVASHHFRNIQLATLIDNSHDHDVDDD